MNYFINDEDHDDLCNYPQFKRRLDAHKKYLADKFEYFKSLDENDLEARLRYLDEMIDAQKAFLFLVERKAFERISKSFLKRKQKCNRDDGIVFSRQCKSYSSRYLIDFDLVFFAASWFDFNRPRVHHFQSERAIKKEAVEVIVTELPSI